MFKNFLNYSLFSVINSALLFINGVLLAKYTSIEMFGLIAFYQVLIIGLSQLISWNTLGLVPVTLSGSIQLDFKRYQKNVHYLMVVTSIFIFLILIALNLLNYYNTTLPLLLLLLVLFVSSNDINNSMLVGLGYSFNYGLALFITRIFQATFIFITGVNNLLNIESWLIIIIISELLSLLYRRNFSLFNLFENTKELFDALKGSTLRFIITYGLKYLPILLFGYLYQYADRYVMKTLMSPSELGLFSYALLLSSSVSIFATSVLNVFVPYIYKNELISSRKILRSSFKINIIAGIIIIIIFESLLPLISDLVGKPEIKNLSGIFLLTSVGAMFQGSYKIIGALLDANILYWQKFCSFFLASAVNIATLYLFFFFSNANVFTFSIAYLMGNFSLLLVSLFYILQHLNRKDKVFLP